MGYQKLKEHLAGLIALQRAAANWRTFYAMVERAYERYSEVPILPFEDENNKLELSKMPR